MASVNQTTFRFPRNQLACAIALACLSQAALAATSGDNEQILPTVSVNANQDSAADDGFVAKRARIGTKTDTPLVEVPQAISVVTRDQLDIRGVQRVTDALNYTSGVTTNAFGADARYDWVFIRGFSSVSLSNYRDGLRQITPACCFSVYRIDPYEMERIEVLKGPSSVLYGQSSPGGIVNRVSKLPTKDPVQEVKVEYGSFQRKQVDIDFGGTLGEQKDVAYRVVGVARDSNTQHLDIKDNRRSISPSLTFTPSPDTSVTVAMNYLEDLNGTSPYYTYASVGGAAPRATKVTIGDPNYSGLWHTQYSLGYTLEHRFDDSLKFRQQVRYSDIKVDYRTFLIGSLQADGRTVTRTKRQILEQQQELAIDNQLESKFSIGNTQHTVLYGLDYMKVGLNNQSASGSAPSIDLLSPTYGLSLATPTTVNSKTRQDQNQLGLYAQDQIKFDQRWIATVGGRFDQAMTRANNGISGVITHQNDSAISGRLGLTYLMDNGFAPYISYSESFLPTIGSDFFGTPFKPTRGKQYEAGVKYQPANSNTTMTASIFEITQTNVTTSDLAAGHTNYSVQTGEVRSRGLELESTTSFKNGVDLIAAYTNTDIVNTQTNTAGAVGKMPMVTPKITASIWGNYTIRGGDLNGLGFGMGARYTGRTAIDALNTQWNESNTIFDAAVFYDKGAWRYSINASNLTNKETTSCGGASCTWGAQRMVNASARFRW